jgi:hypothetical protein
MTESEAKAWLAETARSEFGWLVDSVHCTAADLIVYKGGQSGHYVAMNERDGRHWVSVGTYEGAMPHIGEAAFKRLGRKPFRGPLDAAKWIKEKIGIPLFLSGTPVHCYIVPERVVRVPNTPPLATYKGHKIWIDYDEDEDCRKAFHYVEAPDGRTFCADITPYDDSVEVVCLWIDAGYPTYDNGNWDRGRLTALLNSQQTEKV